MVTESSLTYVRMAILAALANELPVLFPGLIDLFHGLPSQRVFGLKWLAGCVHGSIMVDGEAIV